MKINLVPITVLIYTVFVLLVCTACVTTKAGTTLPLDQAVQEAAKNIEDNVQARQKIAVLNFTSPAEQFSEYVLKELSDRLVNGRKLVVVDRKELDLIRQEENFQLSGEVSDESAQAIGKKLGAQLIVSGSIDAVGKTYRFRIRTLAVETAAIETSYSADVNPKETRVASLLKGTKPAPPPPQEPAAPKQTAISANMVRIEGGTFQMGSNNGRDDGKPVHTVTVISFYMGKYEVTRKEWAAVLGDPSHVKGDNLQVEHVGWYNAIEYCNSLSEKEGLTPAYTIDKNRKDWNNRNENDTMKWVVVRNLNANGYRLPTEAEWEYAARGGNGSPGNFTYAGSNNIDEVAWYSRNSIGSTQEVGAKKPNGLGLYDMSGNVGEWCWDWYDKDYYKYSPQTDPMGATRGSSRVRRGGAWADSAEKARSAERDAYVPFDYWFYDVITREDYDPYEWFGNRYGFRLARNAN